MEPSASMSKEKTFSIAAALPAPCYDSLMHDLSNVCLQSEERLPFSQKELSTLHIAQQLTLLQQVWSSCKQVLLKMLLLSISTARGRYFYNTERCWFVSARLSFELEFSSTAGSFPRMSSSSFPEVQNTRSQRQTLQPKQVSGKNKRLHFIIPFIFTTVIFRIISTKLFGGGTFLLALVDRKTDKSSTRKLLSLISENV